MWPKFGGRHLTEAGFRLCSCARAFGATEDGFSIVVVGLLMPAFIGAMGLAAKVSYCRLHHRAMQNAADSAAIAAATNGTSNYAAEGSAVAAQYGFTNGSGQVSDGGESGDRARLLGRLLSSHDLR
jgi:Flp pilus assembly protein TadG